MSESVLRPAGRVEVESEGRTWLFFGGFDYHRLSRHPEVVEALAAAATAEGVSSGGSRTTTGTHPLHRELEAELSGFLGAPAALVAPNGYQANLIALQSLAGRMDLVLLDEGAHVSLQDAAVHACGHLVRYPHGDAGAAQALLDGHRGRAGRILLASDGVFGLRGDLAPVPALARLAAASGADLLLDDCHALGIVGEAGQGSGEAGGLPRGTYLQTGTLAKALGCYGGVLAGDAAWIESCRATRAYAGCTALPPPLAAAGCAALRLLRAHPEWIHRLRDLSLYFRQGLRQLGWPVGEDPTPVVSLVPRDSAHAEALRARLMARDIYPSWQMYPGAPHGGHYRFALSSAHETEHVDRLLEALRGVG